MKVQILGSGCAKCKTLEQKVRSLNDKHRLNLEIEKVTDLQEIMKFGILASPGLVIEGAVKSSGSIPKDEQLLSWFGGEHK
jgi:small redox-active disulfide protein 2